MRGLESGFLPFCHRYQVHHHMRGLESVERVERSGTSSSPPHAWLRKLRRQ